MCVCAKINIDVLDYLIEKFYISLSKLKSFLFFLLVTPVSWYPKSML